MNNEEYSKLYEKVLNGDAGAMYSLGRLHEKENAEGVWIAERYYRRAARFGHAGAYRALGDILFDRGNTGLAADMWYLAAEKGDADAMKRLGEQYAGEGMTEAAEKYYRRAGMKNAGEETTDKASADSTALND